MSLYNELVEIMDGFEDPVAALEELGVTDHRSLQRFAYRFAAGVGEGLRQNGEELVPEDIGAAIVGGFYLGLAYAHRQKEKEDR